MSGGLVHHLNIDHRDRLWRDRAGWVWRWDGQVKKWAGYDDGVFQCHVSEFDLNDYRNGNGYQPFIEEQA